MKKRWSQDQMPDQTGKLVVITGGTGIAYQVAKALVSKGAEVILGVRDDRKGKQVVADILTSTPQAKVSYELLNLASLGSIQTFAEKILNLNRPLDILVNCAGVMALPQREVTENGFEMHMGTNHLGHFALTGRLIPALKKSNQARVITVSSQAGRWATLDISDLQREHSYSPMDAYGKSKLANVLFGLELNEKTSGSKILSIPVHPGTSSTGINRNLGGPVKRFGDFIQNTIGQPINRVAEPILLAISTDQATKESYIGPTCFMEMSGPSDFVKLPKEATNKRLRQQLWEESERLTGVRY
jgi:NAD(P)-dependent dehydrogenase (short-subunit alcohol dehydrogenase family)